MVGCGRDKREKFLLSFGQRCGLHRSMRWYLYCQRVWRAKRDWGVALDTNQGRNGLLLDRSVTDKFWWLNLLNRKECLCGLLQLRKHQKRCDAAYLSSSTSARYRTQSQPWVPQEEMTRALIYEMRRDHFVRLIRPSIFLVPLKLCDSVFYLTISSWMRNGFASVMVGISTTFGITESS